MFNNTPYSPAQEKKPTLRQWLKGRKGKLAGRYFHVLIAWKPSKFPQWTLETSDFRTYVGKDSDIGNQLIDFFGDNKYAEQAFSIVLDDPKAKTFHLDLSKEEGLWGEIGENGFKFRQGNEQY